GEDDGGPPAPVHVALVQLRRERDAHGDPPEGGARPGAVGVAREQVPAEEHARADGAPGGRRPPPGPVVAAAPRDRGAHDLPPPSGELLLERRRDAARADALHVRVPADREEAGARPAEPAAREREVGEREDVVDAVRVLREAHRPEEHAAPRAAEERDAAV